MRRRNALGRVFNRGSAKHDKDHHRWAQRVTAVAMALLSVWFVVSLLSMPQITYATLLAWVRNGWNAVPLVALILAATQLSYLGLSVVVQDYMHDPDKRIATLLVLRFVHMLLAAAGVFAVFEAAFVVGRS